MIRIFVNLSLLDNKYIYLTRNQTHYLNNVMRKKVGDEILCFNGNDGEWFCRIVEIAKKETKVKIIEQTKKQPQDVDLWLCFALVKNTPLTNIIQKATELGVSKFIPIMTERTNVKKINMERLKTIAVEASEQSDRLSVPEIAEVTKLDDLLKNWKSDRSLIFCDESGTGQPMGKLLEPSADASRASIEHSEREHKIKDTSACASRAPIEHSEREHKTSTYPSSAILIGPEGGFSKNEFEIINNYDYAMAVALGPRILRADTAAIAAISCYMSQKGDWCDKPNFKSM